MLTHHSSAWHDNKNHEQFDFLTINPPFFLREISKLYLYILRGFRKLVIAFLSVKNTPKLINQQLKNGIKIVNWQRKLVIVFFYCQKYCYLKLKNRFKRVNWQK